MQSPVDLVLSRLTSPRVEGRGWLALCPVHGDKSPSLRIDVGDNGNALVVCRSAGCAAADIVDALGLTLADLFVRTGDAPPRRNGSHVPARAVSAQPMKASGPEAPKLEVKAWTWDTPGPIGWRFVCAYDYTDVAGRLVLQAGRFEFDGNVDGARVHAKTFRQRRPDPKRSGRWIGEVKSITHPLYHAPAVAEAAERERRIYIVEGEKDADNLCALGAVATCNPMGAGKWKPEHTAALDRAHVVVIPDNDAPGRKHADSVVSALLSNAASLRRLDLTGLASKGDVSDWIAVGGTLAALDALADAAVDLRNVPTIPPEVDAPPWVNDAPPPDAPPPEFRDDEAPQAMVFALAAPKFVVWTEDGWTEYSPSTVVNALVERGWTVDQVKAHKSHFPTAGGFVFRPGTLSRVVRASSGRVMLNTYRGLPFGPREGDWSLVRSLLLHLVHGDEAGLDYALDWFAAPLQALVAGKGTERCRSALLLHGVPGAGKGLLLEFLRMLYGESFLCISQHQLDDAFDPKRITRSLLVIGDEVTPGTNDRSDKAFQRLKLWVTEDYVSVRNMQTQADEAELWCNLLFFSNKGRPFKLDAGDRRFSVWWQERKLADDLIDRLLECKAARWPVIPAFLHHLVNERTITRKLWKPYENEDRRRLLAGSEDASSAFAKALADEGWLQLGRAWQLEQLAKLKRAGRDLRVEMHRGGLVLDSMLYEAFGLWRAAHGYDTHERVSEAELSRALHKRMPYLRRTAGNHVGERRGRGFYEVPLGAEMGVRGVVSSETRDEDELEEVRF